MENIDIGKLCQRLGKDFCVDWVEGNLCQRVEILSGLKSGESLSILNVENTPYTDYMQAYVSKLRELGLDIGKGNCEYGYRMPLAKKDDAVRELIIFRRS